ncbi:MAG: threonine--tRNA ligase [Deltaproteobacteria bacterium]|nr:MAG: threonine--tRNA ligase [Deltaproteobacteria bacterium]
MVVAAKQIDQAEGEERLGILRHSAAHIMAEAVSSLFPDVKLGIGPATSEGFYYDFDLPRSLSPEDLITIESGMNQIVASDPPFTREEVNKDAAREMFNSQPYKLELIDELEDETATVYRQGSFVDLCLGPHVASAGEVKAVKLLSIAGAYWRGDESRPMLQRIYGTAFETGDELESYLKKLEEAAKRDHRKLGKSLDLYSIHEEAGAGLIYWHPKGAIIRNIIEDFWRREHAKRDYDMLYIPHIAKVDLWKTSGHWEFYQESMYPPIDIEGQGYVVKPMNCPGHILIYKTQLRSYRQLPLRWAELGTVYRWERSGVLHGTTRVRGFTQDDAHIFCRPDQLEEEVVGVIEFASFMLKTFGFDDYEVMLSTRPEKYAGTAEVWEQATETLKRSLERLQINYAIDPGEGVFYGPKIDISLKDSLGRTWQGPTIQVDFNLPERFDVNYIGDDGAEHRVVMIHRTVLGSMERFLGCLIEHYGGAFPIWLAPVQAVVIPITDANLDYAREVALELKIEGIRVEVDDRGERMNLKIREAQLQKVPYMLIIGNEEMTGSTVSVRLRNGQNIKARPVSEFKSMVKSAVESHETI